MIRGIGVDIVDLDRIVIDNDFYKKILTEREQKIFISLSEIRKKEFLGGRFAAKEAYAKALKTGIGLTGFHSIEVLNDENGAPFINEKNVHVSISHEKKYAIAYVIIEE